MPNVRTVIADIIKKHRKKLKMTQSELAEKAGVDPKYISRIETAISSPSLMVVEKIFDILNVDISYLSVREYDIDKDNLIYSINDDLKNTTAENLLLIKNIVKTIVTNKA